MNGIGIAGVHHVKVPVTDLARSRDWYASVLSLEVELEFRDDDGVVRGVAFGRRGGLTLCLRESAEVAESVAGFDPYAVLVRRRSDLEAVCEHLDGLGVAHGPVVTATLGWMLRVPDPDGIELRFYTEETHAPTRHSTAYQVLQRMFDEGFATGDDSVVDELCSPELVEHQFGLEAGSPAEALEHVRAAIRDVHAAAPDLRFTIEDAVEVGDMIWARVRAQGTATGPFFGPPSGRPLDIAVLDVCRIVDGRIVEHWGVPDRFAMLAQTGVLDRLAG